MPSSRSTFSSARASSFSSARPSSFSSERASRPKPVTSVPQQTSQHTPVVTHKVEQPGFFSNVFQGFGLGAGQSIAMNIFRSPTEVKHTYEVPNQPNEYTQCMKETQNDTEACKQYLK
jgi:hypothetical protein